MTIFQAETEKPLSYPDDMKRARDHRHDGHARWDRLLEAHLAGTAPFADRLSFFDHAETCDACRDRLEDTCPAAMGLPLVPRVTAPSELRSSIVKLALDERRQSRLALTDDVDFALVLTPAASPAKTGSDAPPAFLPAINARHTKQSPGPFVLRRTRSGRPAIAPTGGARKRPMARGSMFAGSFAACAGAFALLSGDFHAVPVLHRAQGALRGTIDDARKVAFGQPDRRSGAMTVASVRPRGQNRDVRGASTGDAPRAIALRRLEIPEPAYGATAEYRTVPSGGAETAAAFASAAPRDLRASLDVSGGMAEASSAGAVPVPAEWSGGADERAVDIRIGAGESAAADAANLRRVAEAVRATAEDRGAVGW